MDSVCIYVVSVFTALISSLQEKLNIPCVHNSAVSELFRGIRAQMANLITGKQSSLFSQRV